MNPTYKTFIEGRRVEMTLDLARQTVAQLLMFGPWSERFEGMPSGEFCEMCDAIIARLLPDLVP